MRENSNNLKIEDSFISELVHRFPEIRDEVLDADYLGLITLQIGCFKRFTQSAINRNDFETVKDCFQFVEANIGIVEQKTKNALYISYLSKLSIPPNSKVEKLLPKSFKNSIDELAAYNNRASKNGKLNQFLKDL